ncbi:N-6 DNA methylase [Vibrio parahaemolyticus]|uniref:HsdM family class I SAM-dependent methyltransferase n=1 Tax=Vibrio parahaemolyticus TaxID=670 RepID=UPI003AF95C46
MKIEYLNLLREYAVGIDEVNRIIVTDFLYNNNILNVKNVHISNLMISEFDPDYDVFIKFKDKLNIVTFDDLIQAFEYVISPLDKVVTGAVYTPEIIRDNIVNNIFCDDEARKEKLLVCDPACGCGGFLFTVARKIKDISPDISYFKIYEEIIFGLDLKDYSVERTKILLCLLAITNGEDFSSFNFNIFVGNALSFQWEDFLEGFLGFDVVVGNPPYVASRNIDDESLKLLKNWSVCNSGHPDLYIPFFEVGLLNLKDGGTLGFITMNTFFKSLNGRALREYLSEKQYNLSITDFGSMQIFSSRNTYTCICLIEKTYSDNVYYRKVSDLNKLDSTSYSSLNYDAMNPFEGWNLSQNDIVERVEKVGKPLRTLYKVNSGIATLKNKIYIIDYTDEDDLNYILPCGLKVEKNICVDIVNPNKLIDISDLEILKRKIIFPYKYNKENIAELISKEDLKKSYPNAYVYLSTYKDDLKSRDKGKGSYEEWYAYGRKQGLNKNKYKLFFPHITPKIPNYIISNQEDLLFHNGLAVISDKKEPLDILKVLMSTRLFWFYIINTSKPYGSGYFSLSRNYIKSFGIYDFSSEQIEFLINETNQEKIDKFVEDLYGVNLDMYY